jgi:hypothetical protein
MVAIPCSPDEALQKHRVWNTVHQADWAAAIRAEAAK